MVNLVRGLCNAFTHVAPSKRQELLVEIKSKGQAVVDAMFGLAQVRIALSDVTVHVCLSDSVHFHCDFSERSR